MSETTFPNTYSYLDMAGTRCVNLTKGYINKSRKKASGGLNASLDYDIIENAGTIKIIFEYADYGKFVLDGRKPKSKRPPISAIEKWLLQKKVTVGNSKVAPVGGYKIKGKKGAKNLKRLAFAVATSIGKKGIKPFDFLEYANKYIASDQFKRGYIAAVQKDFELQLQKKLLQ